MVILKKIKGSTLIETLVSSVLIVIIFMIASMILNNLFSNSIKNNTRGVENQINILKYRYLNNDVLLPYSKNYEKWIISVKKINENEIKQIEFEAFNSETNKRMTKIINEN